MSRYQPALLGGVFIGVLSSLPFLRSANACCCLWVVTGGLLTVYLQQQNRSVDVPAAEAALGGLIAGAIGALMSVAVTILLWNWSEAGASFEAQFRNALDQNAQVPPEVRDRVLNVVTSRFLPVFIAAFTVPMYAVFGMLGAFLGLAVFKKKKPGPAAPTPTSDATN